jgi:hypothetical protein
MKTTGGMRKMRCAQRRKLGWDFTRVATPCNLVRMCNLLSAAQHRKIWSEPEQLPPFEP